MAGNPSTLLLTPPLVAPNAPYPATPFLTAALREAGWRAVQEDLSLALLWRVFSRSTLAELAETARARVLADPHTPSHVARFLGLLPRYLDAVEEVLGFLAGNRATLPVPLPEGPRFRQLAELRHAASPLASAAADDDRLRASLFLDDIADVLRDAVDARFGFSRYAERLGASAPTFDALAAALDAAASPIDALIDALAAESIARHRPDIVAITVPFPGNLYAALRIARVARRSAPDALTVLGGGYVSTELRGLTDRRIFDQVDALVFDDGEGPLLRIVEARAHGGGVPTLPRVATRERLPPVALSAPRSADDGPQHRDRPAPTYDGLPLDRYLGIAESANPMHRLWSERFWNKLTLAHGCYWHRCAFCDTSLDYIRRYDPADPDTVVRWMDQVYAETGRNGFHFVDEAAPPALLRGVAERLAARGAPYRWWTNVRLERAFDATLARTLAQGGCIAVTAGLECATDRLLRLMDKGVALDHAAAACAAFAGAGILVHVYLMYGFPTETAEETVAALDFVRGLFARGAIHSAYWHRFALTCHSPVFARAAELGIRPRPTTAAFARNEVPYREPDAPDHDALGEALRTATFNYMHGVGLDDNVRSWFRTCGRATRRPRGRR